VRKDHRSECVMNRVVEVFGDQWSLLVIRDIIFMNRRHFRELLTKSLEGIASNILANRLQRLVEQGIIVKSHDPSHKQKAIYSLTERGIELLPLLMEMNAWGHKYLPASKLKGLAHVLEEGGPKLRAQFMAELRETHLRKSTAPKKARQNLRVFLQCRRFRRLTKQKWLKESSSESPAPDRSQSLNQIQPFARDSGVVTTH
jgi:DNA-binding HxlR family transcriptional regulator